MFIQSNRHARMRPFARVSVLGQKTSTTKRHCPHCRNYDEVYALEGESTRIGRKCGACRKQEEVLTGIKKLWYDSDNSTRFGGEKGERVARSAGGYRPPVLLW